MALHPDRLFPAEDKVRSIARALYATVKDAPIVSPHGHTDPAWYATDAAFPDPSSLFVKPDHYVFRMLYSQGVPLESLGVPRIDGGPVEQDPAHDLAALRVHTGISFADADKALVRARTRACLRHRGAADPRQRRRAL